MAITNWSEYVRDLAQRRAAYRAKNVPQASDMENYFQYKKEGAKLEREWSALLNVIRTSGHFNRKKLEAAIFYSGADGNKLEAVITRAENDYIEQMPNLLRNIAMNSDRYVDASGMSEREKAEQKQKLLNGEGFSTEIYNALTPEERERVISVWITPEKLFEHYFICVERAATKEPAVIGAILRNLGNQIDSGIADNLATELSSVPDLLERPFDEQVTHPYSDRANELKNQVEAAFPDNQEKQEKIKAALEYAAEKLTRVKDEAKKGLMEEEGWIGDATAADYEKEVISQQAAGKKLDVCKVADFSEGSCAITEVDESAVRELQENPGELISDQYKTTLINMLKKMDEMHLLGADETGSAEEPDKAYAYRKIMMAKEEFMAAMEEGDFEKILEAEEKYKKISKDYDDLFQMADGLNNSRFAMQSNIDSTRNTLIPWEYNRDLRKHVQISGVYQIYRQMHALKMSPEEFLSNVPLNGLRYYRQEAYNKGLGACTKGKDFGGIVDALITPVAFSGASSFRNSEKTTRCFDAIQLMEPDQNRKSNLVAFNARMGNVARSVMDAESARATVLQHDYGTEAENAELAKSQRREALENLITVSDENRDLRKILPPPSIGDDGKLEKPFSIDEYVRDNAADYEGMVSRMRILLEKSNVVAAGNFKFLATDRNGNVSEDTVRPEVLFPEQVIEAAFNAGVRVLKAREAEAGSEAYETFRHEILNLITLLPPEASLADKPERLSEVKRIKAMIPQAYPIKSVSELAKPLVDARKAVQEEKEPEAKNRQAYYGYVKKKNEADWHFAAVKKVAAQIKEMSVRQLEDAIASAIGADKLSPIKQKVKDRLEKNLPNRIYQAAAEKGRGYMGTPAYSAMTAEEKTAFRERMVNGEVFDIAAWKDLKAEEKTTVENAFMDEAAKYRGTLNAYEWAIGDDMDTLVSVYSAIQGKLSLYESWLFSKRVSDIPVDRESTFTDEAEPTLEQETKELIKFAERELSGDNELNNAKLSEIKTLLSDVNVKNNAGKDLVIEAQVNRELAIGHANETEEKVYMNTIESMGNKKEWIYFGESEPVANALPILNKEAQAASFPEKKPVISAGYRNTLVSMLRKMKEMELLPEGDGASSEEGTKKYAFRKLLSAKQAFETAVKNKDLDHVIELKKAYDKEWQNMEELMSMARNGLGQDVFSMPGNVDITRNKDVPWTFAGDSKTQAQVNGVYQMYILMQSLGIENPEEFVDNIARNGIKYAHDRIMSAGAAEKAKNKGFTDIIAMLTDKDNAKDLDTAAGDVVRNRWLEALSVMEPDKLNPMGFVTYRENYNRLVLDMAEREKVRLNLFKNEPVKGRPNYGLETKLRKEALENLITVADADRTDLSALIGLPGTDENGKTREVFDIETYAAEKGTDYKGMIERVNTLIYQCAGKAGAPTETEIIEAARSAMRRVLDAHAADRENEGYRALENEYNRLPARVYAADEARPEASVMRDGWASRQHSNALMMLSWMAPYSEEQTFRSKLTESERQDVFGALQRILTPAGRRGLTPEEELDKLGTLMGALNMQISDIGIEMQGESDNTVSVNGVPYYKKDKAAQFLEDVRLLKAATLRGKELLANGGSEIARSMLNVYENNLDMVLEEISGEQLGFIEPMAYLGLPNNNQPFSGIDRSKNPLVPGVTKTFTLQEFEEKKDSFPFHKLAEKSYDLGHVWREYIKKNRAGNYTSQDEEALRNDLKERYQELLRIHKSITDRVEKENGIDEDFLKENDRIVVGQLGGVKKAYEDTFDEKRGFRRNIKDIGYKVEAIDKGWSLRELGAYEMMAHAVDNIELEIGNLDREEVAGAREKAEALRDFLKDKFIGKDFINDAGARAEAVAQAERLYKDFTRECEAAVKRLEGVRPVNDAEGDQLRILSDRLSSYLFQKDMARKLEKLTFSFGEVLANMGERARVEKLQAVLKDMNAHDRTYPQGAKEYMDIKAALREVTALREEPFMLDKTFADRVRSSMKRLEAKVSVMEEGLKKEWFANRKLGEKRSANLTDLQAILESNELNVTQKLSMLDTINKKMKEKSDLLRYASPEYLKLKNSLQKATDFYRKFKSVLPLDGEAPKLKENPTEDDRKRYQAALKAFNEQSTKQAPLLAEIGELLAGYRATGAENEKNRILALEEARLNNLKELSDYILPGRGNALRELWILKDTFIPQNEAEVINSMRTEFTPEEIVARNKTLKQNMEAIKNLDNNSLRALVASGTSAAHVNSVEFSTLADLLVNTRAGNTLRLIPQDLRRLAEAAQDYVNHPESGTIGEKRLQFARKVAETALKAEKELNGDIRRGLYTEEELNSFYSPSPLVETTFRSTGEAVLNDIRAKQNETPLEPEPQEAAVDIAPGFVDDVAAKLIERYDSLQTMAEKVDFYADCHALSVNGSILPDGGDEALKKLEQHMFMNGNEVNQNAVNEFMVALTRRSAEWSIEAANNRLQTGSDDFKYQIGTVRGQIIGNRLFFLAQDSVPYSLSSIKAQIKNEQGQWEVVKRQLPDGREEELTWSDYHLDYFRRVLTEASNGIDVNAVIDVSAGSVSGDRENELKARTKREMMRNMPAGVACDLTCVANLKKAADTLRGLAEDFGGLNNNRKLGMIADSMENLSKLAEKTYRFMGDSGDLLTATGDTASQIFTYLENNSLDRKWLQEKGTIRDELARMLKGLSPELSETWEKRQAMVNDRAEKLQEKRTLLNRYFYEESSTGRDTLKKIEAEWKKGDSAKTREKIAGIINKRYGLGEDMSAFMAEAAIRQLNEVKRLGMKAQEVYKSSFTFMRDLVNNAEGKRLADFEVEGKKNTISVEYVPKLRGKGIEDMEKALKLSGMQGTADNDFGFIKGLLANPERIDGLRRMLETEKKGGIFNWNSGEYNSLKDSLEYFCKTRDEVLNLMDKVEEGKLPEGSEQKIKQTIEEAAGALNELMKDTGTYAAKVISGETVMNKTQNAGLVRAAAAFGLQETFREVCPESYEYAQPEQGGAHLSNEEKVRLKNFTRLYQEEFAKESREMKSNRHVNAAGRARDKENDNHRQLNAPQNGVH